jgi:hypothetical protein
MRGETQSQFVAKLTHVLSFLVKKDFLGRVNFVTIGPKWKVFEKESR